MEHISYEKITKDHLYTLSEKITFPEYHQLLEGTLHGLTARMGDSTAGILLFRRIDKTLVTLERIETEEPFRRQGIATGMMQAFCQDLHTAGVDLLLSFDADQTDMAFLSFLLSLKSFYIEEDGGFEALLSAEEVSTVCKKFASDKIVPNLYFEQSRSAKQQFIHDLEQSYPLIAWEMKHTPEAFRSDLCCCETGKDGSIEALCLLKEQDDEMELRFLYAKGGKGTLAAKALIASASVLQKMEPRPLRMSVTNDNAASILKHMSQNYEITKRMYTAYYLRSKDEQC